MKQLKVVAASVLILGGSWSATIAGVAIKIKEKMVDYEGAESTAHIFLDQNFAKIETQTDKVKSVIIYDKVKEIVYMIDLRDNTVMTLTKEQARQVGTQVSDQMAQAQKMMEEQLKTMPPEQRKLVEDMMKKQMSGKMPAAMAQMEETTSIEYKKVASKVKIGQWYTDHYIGTEGGEKVEEVWTTSPELLGIKQQDIQIMHDLSKFMQEIVGEFGKGMNTQIEGVLGDEKYEGVPVKKLSYDGDEASSETLVEEVVKQDFAKGFFDVPKNLKPKKMFDVQE